jgi:hypothetical protein
VTASTATRLPRLVVALLVGTLTVSGALLVNSRQAEGYDYAQPVPEARCGPGARPEGRTQGRVPKRHYETGRAARGYRCNTRQVSRQGSSGGFKVLRYRDESGHTCAYYDSTLVFPRDVLFNATEGLGVIVLDMTHARSPRQTATLTSPAMLTPHESLLLNQRRGLLAATPGTAMAYPATLDLYDVSQDCRHPRLLSSTPTGAMGHESGFTRDGRTFWSSGTGGQTLVAMDLSDPTAPRKVFHQDGVVYHGLRLSPDGNTMYVANDGYPRDGKLTDGSLRILDVSEVQARKPDPEVEVLSELRWPELSIPQVAEPFTRDGHDYLFEVDEFSNWRTSAPMDPPEAEVGAARIINVDDPRHPYVVSDVRLEVHQPAARAGAQQDDPGADNQIQGYSAHYCSLPRYRNPRLAACSMVLSGLRVFDLRNLRRPREAAYFNEPLVPGERADRQAAWAMSAPAYDVARRQVWYSDVNSGFYAVRLTNGVGRLLAR